MANAVNTDQAETVTATVTGTVTANAGTNLNTSALALETGGNLATAAAALGATTGAAVITDANGTIQQYLRGLVKLLITAGTIVLGAGAAIIGSVRVIGNAGADGSTTITSGGVAQNLFAGATPANGYEIGNPDPTNDLWVSDSTTAAANGTGSNRVAANGGTYTTPLGYQPIGAVSIIGAVTGQKITARKF